MSSECLQPHDLLWVGSLLVSLSRSMPYSPPIVLRDDMNKNWSSTETVSSLNKFERRLLLETFYAARYQRYRRHDCINCAHSTGWRWEPQERPSFKEILHLLDNTLLASSQCAGECWCYCFCCYCWWCWSSS